MFHFADGLCLPLFLPYYGVQMYMGVPWLRSPGEGRGELGSSDMSSLHILVSGAMTFDSLILLALLSLWLVWVIVWSLPWPSLSLVALSSVPLISDPWFYVISCIQPINYSSSNLMQGSLPAEFHDQQCGFPLDISLPDHIVLHCRFK